MNKPPSIDATVAYYDQNASLFSSGTEGMDMSHLYAEFLPLVPKGGKILDAGCGSGRDALFFKQQGYSVTAFDASRELAAIATQSLGESVRVMAFLDLHAVAEFDGIWACASLLHVCSSEMNNVLHRLTHALKPGAPLYVSFKLGTEEGWRSERFFNDYDELKFHCLLKNHPGLSALKLWRTTDHRPGRQHEVWFNAIVTQKA